ncbi:SWF or SNF family helicase [Streptomyces sp. me109]|uniref:SWIM zinc finger family protein n=1 Tax=Streptomyces sp. me109 TaxID=1827853 RepID=UPI0011CD895F|nr:SWF or SNF family helicase [Streptomyces sp. me109]TXS80386.1 SWF or SNF family helicase [Streptomyces sp. me109]
MTDSAEERTFAALPAPHGQGFAHTWWGRAWVKALEDAALDSQQLKAGRRLARAGAVGAVSVRPGRITAVVRDRDHSTHRADVLLQELADEQWDRFLDMTAERAGHVAALLDREIPAHLVEEAADAGIDLLPGLGDLEADCDCGAWDHCGHTSALCYQMARLLDHDPFALLLLRGRAERTLLDELQRRGDRDGGADAPGLPAGRRSQGGPDSPHRGESAAEEYAAGDILPPLPSLPAPPAGPGRPPSLETGTAPAPGVDPAALEFLAGATAAEAYRLLVRAVAPGHGSQPPEEELTPEQDAVRLAAAAPDAPVAERLALGSGRDQRGLTLAVRAWQAGGVAALSVLEDEWTVEGDALARARAALASAWDEGERPSLVESRNRWTVAGAPVQIRLGRDDRWWPYREESGRWTPSGQPVGDPATALALAAGDRHGVPSDA